MRCPKPSILGIVQFLLGVMVFFMGYKFGLDEKRSQPRCGRAPTAATIKATQSRPQPAIPAVFHPFHIHKSYQPPIAEAVFTPLYHPARMEKSEFMLTNLVDWQNKGNKKDPFRCDEIYNTRIGSRTNQPAKCVAVVSVVDGYQSPWKNQHRIGVTAGRTNQFINDFTRKVDREEDFEYSRSVLKSREQLIADFKEKVGDPFATNDTSQTGKRRTLVLMVANEGVLNLLLNFICSCAAAGIDPKSVVVFVGQTQHVHLVASLGATPMFLPDAGSMPHNAANNYGDKTFARMMWLKVFHIHTFHTMLCM
jgi:hypothetical protein